MIDLEELKRLSSKELDLELKKTLTDLLRLRMAIATKQSTETSKIRRLRRYIARVRTLKNALKEDTLKENPKSSVTK